MTGATHAMPPDGTSHGDASQDGDLGSDDADGTRVDAAGEDSASDDTDDSDGKASDGKASDGKASDGEAPGDVALCDGMVSVPPALRAFIEVALSASSADVIDASLQLVERGLGKLASAADARTTLARKARAVAVRGTKLAPERIAANKQTAQAWAEATAEQSRVTRFTYWELQRKCFQCYLAAARSAKAKAQAALRSAPTSSIAQQNLQQAELVEEAAAAPPVAGRLPRNHEFAGKQYPSDRLPPAYRQQGLRFSEAGYPDFSPFARTLPNGQKSVRITYTGSRAGDFAAANTAAGYRQTPEGFTWHHHEDMQTMLLVPEDLHDQVPHTGGVATFKHSSGAGSYGR